MPDNLPASVPASTAENAREAPSQAVRPTLFLVDDDRANLDVLVYILREDYELQIAKSGVAALRRVADRRPDLILLDVLMPDMDGFAVFERLLACGAANVPPVIFVTGLAASEDEERAFRLGAADYIVKPLNPVAVLARVARQLRLARLEALLGESGISSPGGGGMGR